MPPDNIWSSRYRFVNYMWSRYFCFSFDCGDFLEQTACVYFDIPEKLHMGTYLAGKTKINWKKNTWKVVNSWWTPTRVPTVYTPVSYLWILGEMCQTFAQHLDIQIEGQFKILSYIFSETISWARNNKMGVTAKETTG